MTLDGFLEADAEEGYRYELARGVVEVSDFSSPAHAMVVCHLYPLVAEYKWGHPATIFRFGGACEFLLRLPARGSARYPDLSVVLRGTPPDCRGDRPPALVAEVVSPRSRDRDFVAKREEYLAYGVREYWIVNLPNRVVVVLTRDGDTWVDQACRGDEPIRSRFLPGLAATVAEL